MGGLKKKIGVLSLSLCCIATLSTTVFAVTKYSSWYDMTGGVYCKKNFESSSIPKFEINTSPTKGVAGEKILLTCEKKYSWGWGASDNSSVSSTNKDSAVLYGNSKGRHRIYLRQFSGKQMKGNIDIRMY